MPREAVFAIIAALAARGIMLPAPAGNADATPLLAEMNHSRWIANCPACPGAEIVDPADPVFYCLNHECPRPYGATWLAVQFPANRAAIEALVAARPPGNRNWKPGETTGDLYIENALHGVDK